MYSHLGREEGAVTKHEGVAEEQEDVSVPGSEGEGHQDALDSGAGSGQAELHPPVVDQVELHVSTAHNKPAVTAAASVGPIETLTFYEQEGKTAKRHVTLVLS